MITNTQTRSVSKHSYNFKPRLQQTKITKRPNNETLNRQTKFKSKKITNLESLSPVPAQSHLMTSYYKSRNLTSNKSTASYECTQYDTYQLYIDSSAQMTSAESNSNGENKINNSTQDKDSPIGRATNTNFNHSNCIYDHLNEQMQNNKNKNFDSTSSTVRTRKLNQEIQVNMKTSNSTLRNELKTKRANKNESLSQDSDGNMELGKGEGNY